MRRFWLLVLILGGCSTQPLPGPQAPHAASAFAIRTRILHTAEALLGVPYVWGGATPQGMDCSGLVQYAYGQAGIKVPRTTAELYRSGQAPPRLQPGDLLFFKTNPWQVSHVGIYAGNGQMIHVSSASQRVSKVSLDQPYWQERLAGAATWLPCRDNC